jgi:hypothetical protein
LKISTVIDATQQKSMAYILHFYVCNYYEYC